MRVRAIIPAKGNSKRLKKKNIHEVFGKPMIFWSIDACKNSKYKIEPWVSTEDDKIAEVSKSMGANVVLRDPALCEDHILKMEVIRDAARKIEKLNGPADIVVSLQANSPQIRSEHLDAGIDKLIETGAKEIFSVDSDLMQNAAFRIMKGDHVYLKEPSIYCGVIVCDLVDVHTIEDVKKIETCAE